MLKIRLQREGRKNDPSYRVVVTEHTRGAKSQNHVDRVGFYHPKTKEQRLDAERITHWLSVGAQASGTVHNMLIKAGIIKGVTINVLPQKSPVIKEVAGQEDTTSDNTSEESVVEDSKEEVPEVSTPEEKKSEEPDAVETKEASSDEVAEDKIAE